MTDSYGTYISGFPYNLHQKSRFTQNLNLDRQISDLTALPPPQLPPQFLLYMLEFDLKSSSCYANKNPFLRTTNPINVPTFPQRFS